ncbi:hypothetical protein GGI00_002720 [Coemansia sp. RSA 2681]|nr:hypothetical protein GGI00_002720 [Coemansia sp. RSA 2681]
MFACTVSTLALAIIYATATTAAAIPRQPTTTQLEARSVPSDARASLPKRCSGCSYVGCGGCGGCGGYGGYGGYGGCGGCGFPFVSSFTNEFDRNSNRANFNENTLYANNVNANAASDNIHPFTNSNVIA